MNCVDKVATSSNLESLKRGLDIRLPRSESTLREWLLTATIEKFAQKLHEDPVFWLLELAKRGALPTRELYQCLILHLAFDTKKSSTDALGETRLFKWPRDIHGCIGYYDRDFQPQPSTILWNQTRKVAYSAAQEDDRRKHFGPLFQDPRALLEIDFMQSPVEQIDSRTGRFIKSGREFDNTLWGLIVVQGNKTATYLPGVFPDSTSWMEIRDSLVGKAHAAGDLGKFYGYRIQQVAGPLSTLVSKTRYLGCILKKSCQRILKMTEKVDAIPYAEQKGQKIIVNEREKVRNAGTISTLVCTSQDSKFGKDFSKAFAVIHKEEETLLTLLDVKQPDDLQAASFLLQSISCQWRQKKNEESWNDSIKAFVKRCLIQAPIDFSLLDHDFGQPEVLLGITSVLRGSPSFLPSSLVVLKTKTFLEIHARQICRQLKTDFKAKKLVLADIFRLNWQVQFLVVQSKLDNDMKAHCRAQLGTLFRRTQWNSLETNYLAVLFELLCHLSVGNPNPNALLYTCFCYLMTRYRRGLYFFLGFNEARVDITCHVMNGISHLPSVLDI